MEKEEHGNAPKVKRTSELWLGSLPYHPIPKVQAGSARLNSTKARHRQPQPVSSQETLPWVCASTFFLPQTGTRVLHKRTGLLVKKWAEPGPLAATQLREGTTKLPFHCLAHLRAEQKSHPLKMISLPARGFPKPWGGAEKRVPCRITWEEHCRRCLGVHVPLHTEKHSCPLGLQWFTLLMSTSSHNVCNSGGALVQFQAFPWKETTRLLIPSMRFCCQPSWKGLWIQHKEMFGCAAKPSGHTASCHTVGPPNSAGLSGTSRERRLVNVQIWEVRTTNPWWKFPP